MSQISRRTLLAGGAAAGLAALTSCGDDTSSTGTVTTTTPTATSLIAVFPQGEQYLAAGRPQRMPFILADADGATCEGRQLDASVQFWPADKVK